MQQRKICKVTLHTYTQSDEFPQQALNKMEQQDSSEWTHIYQEEIDTLIKEGHKIKQWDVSILYANGAKKDGLVKVMGGIGFPYLQNLKLTYNHIQSIQMLSRMNAPLLGYLDLSIQYHNLWQNQIVQVSALKKMLSEKIESLDLNKNFIKDIQCFSQANWQNMNWIVIDGDYTLQCYNLTVFAKLAYEKIESGQYRLLFSSQRRIKQKLMYLKLVQKFYNKDVAISTLQGAYTKKFWPS